MGKYVINKTAKGFTFHLKADNGETIATSEVYTTLASAKNGIESVRTNAPIAGLEDQTVKDVESAKNPKFEIYNDKAGEFRFRLKAANGQNIAASEGYKAKASCKNGIESVRKNAVSMDVESAE